MRGKPGYEHLNEPLHILIEAELPIEIIDARLIQARDVLQDLLKPVVNSSTLLPVCIIRLKQYHRYRALWLNIFISLVYVGRISGFLQEAAVT